MESSEDFIREKVLNLYSEVEKEQSSVSERWLVNSEVVRAFAHREADIRHFQDNDGLGCICAALKEFASCDGIVYSCAKALEAFSTGKVLGQNVILNNGTISAMVCTIEKSQDLDTTEAVLSFLYMFVLIRSALDEMRSKDIVLRTVKMLNRAIDRPSILCKGMLVIANVCIGQTQAKLEFWRLGGIGCVVAALKKHTDDFPVNECAALLLRTIGSGNDFEKFQVEIAREATLPLLRAIQAFISERNLVYQACGALKVASDTSALNRNHFQMLDFFTTLTQVLTTYADDKDLCADGLALLRNAVVGDKDGARAELMAKAEDSVLAVSRAMKSNPHSHEVQLRGAQVLRYASFVDRNRELVKTSDAISAIAGAIRYADKNKTNGAVFYVNVILALGNACFEQEDNKYMAGKSGALVELVKLLDQHRDLLDVQDAGLRTLRCLTDENEFNARIAASVNALSLCTTNLVGHSYSADICENGFALLLNLCYCRDMLDTMKKAGFTDIVSKALKEKHPSNRVVQIQGQRILVVLEAPREQISYDPSEIANPYEDYIDEVVLPTRSSGTIRRALCG